MGLPDSKIRRHHGMGGFAVRFLIGAILVMRGLDPRAVITRESG
jgi:hypothetical protein